MGATESNAGDDYHFWWAAERAFELLRPGTDLMTVTVETADAELDEDTDQIVDVGEYFVAADVTTAAKIALTQIKYSTKNPHNSWTLARLTPISARASGSDPKTPSIARSDKSIIGAMAKAYAGIREKCRPEAQIALLLVSNQPADTGLVDALAAAQSLITSNDAWNPGSSSDREQMPTEYREVVRALVTTSKLTGGQAREFLLALDLSGCGGVDRSTLHDTVSRRVIDDVGEGSSEAISQLVDLVRAEAMPDTRGVIDKARVLTRLGFSDDWDFLPSPERLDRVSDPVATDWAAQLAELVSSPDNSTIWLHGDPGVGKTQTVSQVRDHLPPHSVVILYDCFGAGTYLDTGLERHTEDAFVRQVCNSLALDVGSKMLLGVNQRDKLWQHLLRRLHDARERLPADAALVIVADAADNARYAAARRGRGSFLDGLRDLQMPSGVTLVISTQTARAIPGLRADAELHIDGYKLPGSRAFLRKTYPGATDSEEERFHMATGGNPRVQRYALETAAAEAWSVEEAITNAGLTPAAMFEMILKTARHGCSSPSVAERLHCLLMTSQRPLRYDDIRATATVGATGSVTDQDVAAFFAGLAPGVRLRDGLVLFSDENFERFLADEADGLVERDPSVLKDALSDWGVVYLGRCEKDLFSAECVAAALAEAGMLGELITLARTSGASVVKDAGRRRHLIRERHRLAIEAAIRLSDATAGLELAVRAASASGSDAAVNTLLFRARALGVRFGDADYLKSRLFRMGGEIALTAYHCLMARVALSKHDLEAASGHVLTARGGRPPSQDPGSVSAHEMACLVVVAWTLNGASAALDLLEMWVPHAERADVLSRTVRLRVVSDGFEILDDLVSSDHPTLQMLGPRAAVAAGLEVSERHRLGEWIQAGVAQAALASGLDPFGTAGESPPESGAVNFRSGDTPYQSFARRPRGVRQESSAERRQVDPWAANETLIQAMTDALGIPCADTDIGRLSWEDPASEDFMRIPAAERYVDGLLPYAVGQYGSIDADAVRRLMRLADEAHAVGEDLQRYLLIGEPDPGDRRTSRVSDGVKEDLGDLVMLCDLRSAAIWGDDADAQRLHDHVMASVESREASVRERRWYQPDERYRAWAGVAFDGLLRAGYEPQVAQALSATAAVVHRSSASDVSADLSRIVLEHDLDFVDTAVDLVRLACQQAIAAGRTAEQQANLRCVGALRVADLRPDVAAAMYADAIDIVMAAPEEEISEVSILASLTASAHVHLRDDERRALADDLVRRVEKLAGRDATALNWRTLFTTLGALDLPTALAAASRWEDSEILPFDESLPPLITAASGTPQLSHAVALALLESIPDDRSRLEAGITILGADDVAPISRRAFLAGQGEWIRRHSSAEEIPKLESLLTKASGKWGLAHSPTRRRPPRPARRGEAGHPAQEAETHVSVDTDSASDITLVVGEEGRWEQLGLGSPTPHGARSSWDDRPAQRDAMLRARLRSVAPALRVAALDAVLDGLRQSRSFAYFVPDVLVDVTHGWHGSDVREWLDNHVGDIAFYAMFGLMDIREDGARSLAGLGTSGGRQQGVRLGVLDFIAQVSIEEEGSELSAVVEQLIVLSESTTSAAVLRALPSPPQVEHDPGPTASTNEAVAHFLYSLFGHPRRAMRWRAAHAVRRMAQAPEAHEAIDRLCLLSCEELTFDSRYRSEALFFFEMSAQMWTLVAIERLADESSELIRPHLQRLVRLATSSNYPHAAVRELARRTALKIDPTLDLASANQPRARHVRRRHSHISDQRTRGPRRYELDAIDTIPYWFGHLARVFGVEVEQVATAAEEFVVDQWGFSRATWWSDGRELRDERSFGSSMHRQGIVPPVESVSRYIDYHAMLAAAGAMIDRGIPILIEDYSDADYDPWASWLADHLPGRDDCWLADTADQRPELPDARYDLTVTDLEVDDFADVLGIADGSLPKELLAYASRDFYLPGAPAGHVWIASALVTSNGVGALQRALETSTNPSDWKLPSEGEEDFEFARFGYAMTGWLDDRDHGDLIGLDAFDPHAVSLRWETHLPGKGFREVTGAKLDERRRTLSINGSVVARASQWGDARTSQTSTWVDSAALVRFLRAIDRDLIIDVQIALDDRRPSTPRPARAHTFHVDQNGKVHSTEPWGGPHMSDAWSEVNPDGSDYPAGTTTGEDFTGTNDGAVAAVEAMSGEDLLALGGTLVSELGYTTSNDILGRWMAHHAAEVMVEVEQHAVGTAERRDAEEQCRRLILDLWAKRHARPESWPHPSAVEIVKLLAELPTPETDWWRSQTSIGQLQELHYRILGSITDWLAATTDTSIDETWLSAFGTLLTEHERLVLSRVAGASSRSSDMTSGLSGLLSQYGLTHDPLGIADADNDPSDASRAAAARDIEDDAANECAPGPDEPTQRARRTDRRPSPAEFQAIQTVDVSVQSKNALEQLDVLSAAYMDVVTSIASVIEAASAQRDASTEQDT